MKNKIKERREKLKMTMEHVAYVSHTTKSHIHNIEKGKCDPGLKLAFRISKTLQFPIDKLFCFKENFGA